MIIMNWKFDRTKKRLVGLLRFPEVDFGEMDIWAVVRNVPNWISWRTNTMCECYRMWYNSDDSYKSVKVSYVCDRDLEFCRYGMIRGLI